MRNLWKSVVGLSLFIYMFGSTPEERRSFQAKEKLPKVSRKPSKR